MSRRRQTPSLRTNSPRVHSADTVAYARVMGERVSMNREGLTDPDRREPVRIRYADMSRPDRPQRQLVRPRHTDTPYVAPEYPTWDYLDEVPEPEPVIPLPRREPGPLRYGSAPRTVQPAPTVQLSPEEQAWMEQARAERLARWRKA